MSLFDLIVEPMALAGGLLYFLKVVVDCVGAMSRRGDFERWGQ